MQRFSNIKTGKTAGEMLPANRMGNYCSQVAFLFLLNKFICALHCI